MKNPWSTDLTWSSERPIEALLKSRVDRIPLGFMGDGRDTANAALFLASEEARFVTGTEILVDGYKAKNGSNRANGRDLTFADGRKLFLGSSGIGAPRDGKDPDEK